MNAAGQPGSSPQRTAAGMQGTSGSEGNGGRGGGSGTSSTPPAISLPKGGGAIRGMGEKFSANPVTGTGSLSVPIYTSPGRSAFGPQLSLSYDSGAGNGPFGFGWNLSLPSITRKTDKGLPQYRDAEESDVFILSDSEDLVPVLVESSGQWQRQVLPPRTVGGEKYEIRRYRPRIEGLFARIERWSNEAKPEDTFWRSISKDNITTWYGKSAESRIADPADPTRIFSWLICESYDDKGNAILYEYEPSDPSGSEGSAGIDLAQAHEGNRTNEGRSANRYLKRIKYGNRTSRLVEPDLSQMIWLFEVVFDYDEGHYEELPVNSEGRRFVLAAKDKKRDWSVRQDPFSSYRAGFEVRTYRLCRRVLMFHHFPNELDTDDYLVRSTEFVYDEGPIASFITSVTQSGYVRETDGKYLKRSLPPLEFEYSKASIQDQIEDIDARSLENLPQGVDGTNYRWVDLDGEGLSGVLTEQGGGWFYKRNLGRVASELNGSEETTPLFAPVEPVANQPSLAGAGQQLLDLAGDGQLDLVRFEEPLSGYYERTGNEGWSPFVPFESAPNVAWGDPNLRFVDLTGDGHADVLITEGEAITWYPSLAEAGFAPAERARQAVDEEKGPRLVFADGQGSIHLADLSGDGLTDLVRIRNGEVCYWPNLGYGRFGAKVTMDDAPHFDSPDQFEGRRVQLADIDGSGVTDIVYLGSDGICLYFNHSGNGWSEAHPLPAFPGTDDLSSVAVADLFGNGTACLVWSSPLPGDARRPMRYLDLMGRQKPHLLITTRNNLGAETRVEYAPSTKFYLQDRAAGKPWVTRLPFPVHCVEKVTVSDKWRGTRFSTNYSYHHGYFDGEEREFRGFGRVEQVDVESYDEFDAGNPESPYITDERELYQPPVKTVTWYHTGASTDRDRILSSFKDEYFPHWFEASDPSRTNVLGTFRENDLPEPDLDARDFSVEEWRGALRACKGMTLRQEIYELDVDALEQREHRPIKLFSTAYHNCHVRRLQPRAGNRHAVFLVTESEAITYNYELDLRQDSLMPDPRIAHTLNLRVDELGNVLQSVAAVYPRRGRHVDEHLPESERELIDQVQRETHMVYTENRYTEDFEDPDNHRLRVPCEVLSYELTGIDPKDEQDLTAPDTRDDLYFTLDELRRYRLSHLHQALGEAVAEIPYHQIASRTAPEKRLVEHVRVLFFDENLVAPLPFGESGRLGLPYETYKLALTGDLIGAVFGNKLTDDVRTRLADYSVSGYLSGATLASRFGGTNTTGQYWIRSRIAGFAPDAHEHFYLPERYTDAFGNVTTLQFDEKYDLFVRSSTDPKENTVLVEDFDFRVLAPKSIKDINDNLSEVYFDILGMPVATALKGKGDEGDSFEDFDDALANPDLDTQRNLFNADYDEDQARTLRGNATARHVYYFGEKPGGDGSVVWGSHPPSTCSILREKHVAQLPSGGQKSPIQTAFEYSDGMGAVVVKKARAEPAPGETGLRWIASGKTILNNKGKPVKQYEPYFSESGHRFEEPREAGVATVMYYDAPGRLVRTESPDGTFSRVEFSPWHVATYDANDTVLEQGNSWYKQNSAATASAAVRRAARLAAGHADTPAVQILDTLGREVVGIAHNREEDGTGTSRDKKFLTYTKLDAEGKPLWIRDARSNLVMQYISPPMPDGQASNSTSGFVPAYDISGNLLFHHSMDAGDRWMLPDAAGKPMFAWDFNQRQDDAGTTIGENRRYFTRYDELQRPIEQWLKINGASPLLVERYEYGEQLADVANARKRNLRGQLHRHYDPSGLNHVAELDFKGNPCEVRRTLASQYSAPVIDWQDGAVTAGLEAETFIRITEYDALGRMTRLYNWHKGLGSRVAVYEPLYNERGLLRSEDIVVRAEKTEEDYEMGPGHRKVRAIEEITYNARGQKELIRYGNGTLTRHDYDEQTFRLVQLRTTRPGYDPAFPNAPSSLKNAEVLQNLHHTYDPVGNIAEIRDDAFKPAFFNNQKVYAMSRYTYDALYRLVEATGREDGKASGAPGPLEATPHFAQFPVTDPEALRNYKQTYAYDLVGNISRMKHTANGGSWTRNYGYDTESNRLLSTWQGNDTAGATKYRYDAHGNMLNLANVPPARSVRWDHWDTIRALDLQGGGWAYYDYDAGKQRTRKVIEKQTSTKHWERIYLGGLEIYRRYSNGTLVEEIESLQLFEDEQLLLLIDDVLQTDNAALPKGPLFRYQYSNHLGSAYLELDEQSKTISYEEYHPYGSTSYQAVRKDIQVPHKRYRYTGKERDEENGFSYHGARYYATWLGRWTACDPIGFADGPNLYIYARCNPCALVDPSGTQSEPKQLELIQQTELRQPVTATATGRGISPKLRAQYQALGRQWQLGLIDVGHEKPFATTPAGETERTYAQPRSENRSLGAREDKAAAAAAKKKGGFARVDGVDPAAKKGTRYGQPEELPKLKGVENTSKAPPPVKTPAAAAAKAPTAQPPKAVPPVQQFELPFETGLPAKPNPPAAMESALKGPAEVIPKGAKGRLDQLRAYANKGLLATAEYGPKVLRVAGALTIVVGARNQAKTAWEQTPGNWFNKDSAAIFTFATSLVAGALDDVAIAKDLATTGGGSYTPVAMDTFEREGGTPLQVGARNFWIWVGKVGVEPH